MSEMTNECARCGVQLNEWQPREDLVVCVTCDRDILLASYKDAQATARRRDAVKILRPHCRHRRVESRAWTGSEWDVRSTWSAPSFRIFGMSPRQSASCHALVCCDCGAWLPLGPAHDDGEHAAAVAIEVRAAEIAELWHAADPAAAFDFVRRLDHEECRGWSLAETNMQNHSDRWHAGYLARAITTHDTEQEGTK